MCVVEVYCIFNAVLLLSTERSEPHMTRGAAFMEGILIAALYDFIITMEPIACETGDHDLQEEVYYAGYWRKRLLDAHETAHPKVGHGPSARQKIELSELICGILFEVSIGFEFVFF